MKARIQGLDSLKAIAIFAVVIIHVPASLATETLSWQLVVQCCRFAVPCFFLVSGYLFMQSWETSPDQNGLLLKYLRRLGSLFLLWTIFYALAPPFPMGAPEGIPNAIRSHLLAAIHHPRSLLLNGSAYHLWFLSALLQGLTVTWLSLRFSGPKCAVIIGAMLYLIALSGGPYASTPFGFVTDYDLKNGPYFSTLFVALGSWIARDKIRLPFISAVLLALSGLVISIGEFYFLHSGSLQSFKSVSFSIGTIPFALGILFLSLLWSNPSPLLTQIGVWSLGLYVTHVYVIEIYRQTSAATFLLPRPTIFAFATFMTSLAVVAVLAKVPYIRKLVS